jgi:hypothetical protein
MGTQEDQSYFHLALLQDIGFNAYRFTNLTRWLEPVDDTAYGALTVAAIKANPNVIPWSTWDANADSATQSLKPNNLGQSVRQTIIQLNSAGITPLGQINEKPPGDVPTWMPDATDPTAFNNTNNYNEMWEHCFAIAYWLNVRNNYNMDVYQIANEPDYEGYNQANYFAFFHLCRDAVQYVYATYLPGRTPIMTAPVESQNTGAGDWVDVMLQTMGNEVDWVDFHPYTYHGPWLTEVQNEQTLMNNRGYGSKPKYLSEFGYLPGIGPGNPWTDAPTVASLQHFMLVMSMPAVATHADAWSFYEFTNNYGATDVYALVINGTKTPAYYATRQLVRAMKGARPVYNSISTNPDLTALTSLDAAAAVYHIMVQNSSGNTDTATVDLSALIPGNRPSTTLYRYDSSNQDVQSAGPAVTNGAVSFVVNAYGSVDLVVPR